MLKAVQQRFDANPNAMRQRAVASCCGSSRQTLCYVDRVAFGRVALATSSNRCGASTSGSRPFRRNDAGSKGLRRHLPTPKK